MISLIHPTRGSHIFYFCISVFENYLFDERKKTFRKKLLKFSLSKKISFNISSVCPCNIFLQPVWAIGTGLSATPEIAQAVHAAIRKWLTKSYGADVANAIRILYGGSVTPESIDELMRCPDIDGALVGGAALNAKSFARICMYTA